MRVLRAAGYTASLRVLQRALLEVRQECSREHRLFDQPWVSAPGEFLVVDWGDVGAVPGTMHGMTDYLGGLFLASIHPSSTGCTRPPTLFGRPSGLWSWMCWSAPKP